MKSFLKNTVLGSAMLLCAAGSASANQLLVFINAGDIANAAKSIYTTQCGTGSSLMDCGVFAVGFVGAATVGLQTNETIGAAAGTQYQSPATGSAAWVTTTFGGFNAYMAGGAAAGDTQEQFITTNTNLNSTAYSTGTCTSASNVGSTPGCFDANLNGTVLKGITAMSATTQIGFLLNFTNNIAAGTTANISLRLISDNICKAVGAGCAAIGDENTTAKSNFATITGLSETLVATPEPASIGLVFSGLALLAASGYRRRRKQ